MTEAAKALAIDPENPEVNELTGRLQAALTVRQERQDRAQRLAGLLSDGRRLLDEKKYREAAGVLSQATQLAPDSSDARDLLTRARSDLAKQLEAQKSAEERRTMVDDGLAVARQRGDAGDYAAAIESVQSALALDPQNAEARDLLARLLVSQDRTERDRVRNESVQALLDQSEQRQAEGDFAGSLSLVTRALTADPSSRRAVEMLQRVQRSLRRELIGTIGQGALPPQVSFIDDRRGAARDQGDPPVEQVDYPNFMLSGAVYSSTQLARLEYTLNGTVVELDGSNGLELQDGQFMTPFQFSHTLPTGRSTFSIQASDTNGKSVTSEYAVRYVVPFYLATWFYASLLGLVGMVGTGAYARHVIVRKRKLKRRFNPYIAGAPVVHDDQFYGRDNLMTRVLQTIHNNSILLYGERRIGKTSFQHRLKKRLQELQDPDFDFYPVYIDLQGIPETKFFATLAHDVLEELAPVLEGLQVGEALRDGAEYDYRNLVRDLRSVLHRLREHSGGKKVKLVLLIDEVDELNSYDPRINQRLRSLFMKSFAEDMVAVVSGVGIKKHWESEGSPWYNFFEEIPVKPFRREDAADLIERPIRGVFKLEQGVTDRIITLTDCKPYLIQKLCVSLVNRLHEEGRRVITLTDVDSLERPQEE